MFIQFLNRHENPWKGDMRIARARSGQTSLLKDSKSFAGCAGWWHKRKDMFHRKMVTPWVLLLTALLPFGRAARADDFEFFEKNIRPLLAENCYKCHSAQSESSKAACCSILAKDC